VILLHLTSFLKPVLQYFWLNEKICWSDKLKEIERVSMTPLIPCHLGLRT
jgi:hypothetical protein